MIYKDVQLIQIFGTLKQASGLCRYSEMFSPKSQELLKIWVALPAVTSSSLAEKAEEWELELLQFVEEAVPTEYSPSASDPLTSSTQPKVWKLPTNERRRVISCIPTHQPLPQSGIAQPFLSSRKRLQKFQS